MFLSSFWKTWEERKISIIHESEQGPTGKQEKDVQAYMCPAIELTQKKCWLGNKNINAEVQIIINW
jgi:hypothetical protein